MQNDFLTGMFRLPCEERANEHAEAVSKFVERAGEAGAAVLVTLSYKADWHCSFESQWRQGQANPEARG